jgi:hypothetical protein
MHPYLVGLAYLRLRPIAIADTFDGIAILRLPPRNHLRRNGDSARRIVKTWNYVQYICHAVNYTAF